MKHICTKFVAMLLVIAMIAGVLPFAFAANVGPFTDVKDTDWFASNVQYVYDNGLMNGTTTTHRRSARSHRQGSLHRSGGCMVP